MRTSTPCPVFDGISDYLQTFSVSLHRAARLVTGICPQHFRRISYLPEAA